MAAAAIPLVAAGAGLAGDIYGHRQQKKQSDKMMGLWNQQNTQANLPKSPLSQQMNNTLMGINPDVISRLMNAQNMGNSFAGVNPTLQTAKEDFSLGADLEGALGQDIEGADLSGLFNNDELFKNLTQWFSTNAQTPLAIPSGSMQDNEYYNAVSAALGNKQGRDTANLRARFGGTGTSRGTGAARAEAIGNAEGLHELAAALGGIRQNEQALELGRVGEINRGILGRGDQFSQLLQGLGQLNLGQSNLRANADIATKGLNLDRLRTLTQGRTDMAGINSTQNRFNADAFNSQQNLLAQLKQQAQESQLQRQFQGLRDLFGGSMDLAGRGMTGGNQYPFPAPAQPFDLGGSMAGMGDLLKAFSQMNIGGKKPPLPGAAPINYNTP